MNSTDVLIVGGGPAGSTCAWKLRQAGLQVTVLDKATFPRHKVCAGWITPAVIDELKIDVDAYRRQLVMQPITQFLTGMIGGSEVETDYHRVVSFGIRRWEFDDYLLRRSGAELRMGEAYRSLRRDENSWIVNESIRAPIVIGAGGHFCPVRRHFEPKSNPTTASAPDHTEERQSLSQPVVMAQEVEFELTPDKCEQCTVLAERPELFFCPDLRGYGWIFRKGNWLNIGLGREEEAHLSNHVADFVSFLQDRSKIPLEIPGPFHGHAYHLRTHLSNIQTPEGILLIGDAAGLADRQSGEGIRPAIESGLLAAASVLESRSNVGADVRQVYQDKMRHQFPDSSMGTTFASYIPAPLKLMVARWLMSSHWFNRRVVLDRWFLHSRVPALKV